MPPNPVNVPRHVLPQTLQQERIDPFWRLSRVPTPFVFTAFAVVVTSKYEWPFRWLLSGTAAFSLAVLTGAAYGNRILPFVHPWIVLVTLHLIYAVSATSWLLYVVYTAVCWPGVAIVCLIQFAPFSNMARGWLRGLVLQLHFVKDKIAFFDLPALEFDVEVPGLFVIRGATLSLSTLTLEAHGIELGIKLTDDLELAIQVECVTAYLFRRVEVGDIYMNLKGGMHEMTFGEFGGSTKDSSGDDLMSSDTALLRAASLGEEGSGSEPRKVKMTDRMTGGKVMKDSTAYEGLDEVTRLCLTDEAADQKFKQALDWIKETNGINRARKEITGISSSGELYATTEKSMRAAICSHLHNTPSVPHPPKRSIKLSTLKKSSHPGFKRQLHRFPLLLRLLLNPICYFHPVRFSSITCSASGQWLQSLLKRHIFQDYTIKDVELRNIEERLSTWLADANFAAELHDIIGLAQVPIVTEYDITAYILSQDVLVYRSLPKSQNLKEVVRLGGADATFTVPSYLLPRHEHILPQKPTIDKRRQLERKITETDGKPQRIQAEHELEQAEKDEANVGLSVHSRLPLCLDQALLDFAAALVKATKLVEIDKEGDKNSSEEDESDAEQSADSRPGSPDSVRAPSSPKSLRGLGQSFKRFNHATRGHFKKSVVGGMVNDRWIAKLVGKLTKMLENAQGDIGYSGAIPVPLHKYRMKGVGEASKILP